MRDPIPSRSFSLGSLTTIVACWAIMVALPGCQWGFKRPPGRALEPRAKPVLPYQISKADLVAHLNQNTDKVRSWISRDCTMVIKIPTGIPIRLKGTIACEEPRNFRLVADGGMGLVRSDIGSNEDYCWWWMQPGEDALFSVPHDELDYVRNHPLMQQTMSMPFEPDWLMEVLGVTRVANTAMTMHRDSHPEHVNLASEHNTKDGRLYRRITVVDLHAGTPIAHRIVDSSNHTIARAKLSNFTYEGGAQMPGRIEVDWPGMEMSMTLTIGNLTVNSDLRAELWQPPPGTNKNVINLAEHLRRVEQSGHQYKKMTLTPERPNDRPLYDGGVQNTSAIAEEEMPWDDEPAPRKKWFQWPRFGRDK